MSSRSQSSPRRTWANTGAGGRMEGGEVEVGVIDSLAGACAHVRLDAGAAAQTYTQPQMRSASHRSYVADESKLVPSSLSPAMRSDMQRPRPLHTPPLVTGHESRSHAGPSKAPPHLQVPSFVHTPYRKRGRPRSVTAGRRGSPPAVALRTGHAPAPSTPRFYHEPSRWHRQRQTTLDPAGSALQGKRAMSGEGEGGGSNHWPSQATAVRPGQATARGGSWRTQTTGGPRARAWQPLT